MDSGDGTGDEAAASSEAIAGSEPTASDETGRVGGGQTDPDAGGVALFVDGPNVLRDEFHVDLDDVRRAAEAEGPLVAARLYLDEHAPPGLIQAAEARGFEVMITSGDVDVKLAVDAARYVAEGRMAVLAVASRDTDFKPVVEAANEHGIRTLAVAPGEFGRSDALRNAANGSVTLDGGATDDAASGDEEDSDGDGTTAGSASASR